MQKADSLYNQGLPKSALEIIDPIITKAKHLNDHGMTIRGMIYRFRYLQEVEEETFVKLIGILILLTCGKQYAFCGTLGSRVLRNLELLGLAPPPNRSLICPTRMAGSADLEQKGNSGRETLQLGEIDQWQFFSKKV